MRIAAVEAVPLTAALQETFRFGTTDRTTSPNVVVVVRTDEGHEGYGEACPVPAFTGETQSSIVDLVEGRVAPVLIGADPLARSPLLHALAGTARFAPFTAAAVDTALLDLAGRILGVPAHALLGGAFRDRVEVHGSVGWQEDPADMARTAARQAATYRTLKVYAGRGELSADLDRLAAVRAAAGPGTGLFADVNGMWAPGDLPRVLPRLKEIGITLLEQPLPPAAAAFQRDLVASHGIGVVADEAVRTAADAAQVAASRSASVVNVGHSKLGGPTAAFHAAGVAAAHGLGVMVGSVIEMGIATAMGLHLAAALPRLACPCYLMGPLKYRERITTEQIEVIDGHVAVPAGPGLGVTVDERRLHALDARRRG
ncbi:MAG: hypothetical protein J2P25_18350 [Nocardiopsaceae bacterium]|nr:hypothetical protein [Nocardiopsaceae bacterium]